jgi:hypothetical protein
VLHACLKVRHACDKAKMNYTKIWFIKLLAPSLFFSEAACCGSGMILWLYVAELIATCCKSLSGM